MRLDTITMAQLLWAMSTSNHPITIIRDDDAAQVGAPCWYMGDPNEYKISGGTVSATYQIGLLREKRTH